MSGYISQFSHSGVLTVWWHIHLVCECVWMCVRAFVCALTKRDTRYEWWSNSNLDCSLVKMHLTHMNHFLTLVWTMSVKWNDLCHCRGKREQFLLARREKATVQHSVKIQLEATGLAWKNNSYCTWDYCSTAVNYFYIILSFFLLTVYDCRIMVGVVVVLPCM